MEMPDAWADSPPLLEVMEAVGILKLTSLMLRFYNGGERIG